MYYESQFNYRWINKEKILKKVSAKKLIALVKNMNKYHVLQEVDDIQNDNKVVHDILSDINLKELE